VTLLEQLRAAWRPLLAWFVALLLGMGSFLLVLLATDQNFGEEDAQILLVLGLTSVLGSVLGAALALARIRELWLVAFGIADWMTMATVLLALDGAQPEFFKYASVILLFLPVALTGGYWSLATNRALFSLWHPVVYFTGAIIVWIEKNNGISDWMEGDKLSVWDGMSAVFVALMVFSCLAYLAAHEGYRLALWRRGPRAQLPAREADRGDARPRADARAWLTLVGMAAALTVGTMILAPWLWRTGPEDGDAGGDPSDAPTPPPQIDPGLAEKILKAVSEVLEMVEQVGGVMCNALGALLLLALLFLAVWRPLRRAAIQRHLREPFWDVPPTRRIEQAWRAVEIALGDVGVHAVPGEDASGLARRARPVLEELSPVEVHGLEEAAAIADRVRFGLGVQPGDEATIVRFARWACDTVWERMDDRAQLRAMYRRLR
jgi:hypothetical protein